MLTVTELLSHPMFKNFNLVSDRSGLNNIIRNSGIFEWESGAVLDKTFHPGDFVITTLSLYRDMPDVIDPILIALLDKNLSALCVKDVYFKEFSDEVIDYANKVNTPLYTFSDTSFDDIVYAVRTSLNSGSVNLSAIKNARDLLYEDLNSIECEMTAKEINPYFHENIICGCWMPRDRNNVARTSDEFLEEYSNRITSLNISEDVAYSVIVFPNGIITIYTDLNNETPLEEGLIKLGIELELDTDRFSLGIGRQHNTIVELGNAMKESIYASTMCLVDEVTHKRYDDIGIAKVLCPLYHNSWIMEYLNESTDKLKAYDEKHGANMLHTLLEYVKCNGDINETAEKVFQHSNTIRYRIEKIAEILGINEAPDKKSQLLIIARLYEINNILHGLRL